MISVAEPMKVRGEIAAASGIVIAAVTTRTAGFVALA
jgi:hypothetical protein